MGCRPVPYPWISLRNPPPLLPCEPDRRLLYVAERVLLLLEVLAQEQLLERLRGVLGEKAPQALKFRVARGS